VVARRLGVDVDGRIAPLAVDRWTSCGYFVFLGRLLGRPGRDLSVHVYQQNRSDEPEPLLPGPAKGHDRTVPGRRPFRGGAGTASVVTPRAIRTRLAGSEEGRNPCSRMVHIVNGALWSRHCSGCDLRSLRMMHGLGTSPKLIRKSMLLDRGGKRQEKVNLRGDRRGFPRQHFRHDGRTAGPPLAPLADGPSWREPPFYWPRAPCYTEEEIG
jgi:hypothetical protein